MKKYVIVLSITIVIVGIIVCCFLHFNGKNRNSYSADTTVNVTVKDSEAVISSINSADEEIDYPFDDYKTSFSSAPNIVDELNDNIIDKKYIEDYRNDLSPQNELKVLDEWNKAYIKEFENAKVILEEIVNEKSGSDIKNEYIKAVIDYSNSALVYAESASKIAYYSEKTALGTGSGHSFDLVVNTLEINRCSTLRLIECIILLNGDYQWAFEE